GGAVRAAEVLIEAVVEDLAMKRRLFADVQDAAPHDALLATNTSSLSIAVIAQAVRDPARVLGLHFFNPVHAMRLVEVVTHERSDPGVSIGPFSSPGRSGRGRSSARDSPGAPAGPSAFGPASRRCGGR